MKNNTFQEFYKNFISNKSPFEDPFKNYPKGKKYNKKNIITLLEECVQKSDSDSLEYLLSISYNDGLDYSYSKILCDLLKADWHELHEDIVFYLDAIADPGTTKCISDLLDKELKYLEYDSNYSLQKKCIWALSSINTEESKQIISILAQSDNPIIKDAALKELEKN